MGGVKRACLWNGTAASWVELHPANAAQSYAYSASDTHQVGYADVDFARRASLWSGTSASWVDLHPSDALASIAYAVNGSQQAGVAEVMGTRRASLWSGTAASWVDLHPAGASSSEIRGMGADQQVGFANVGGNRHASLWTGTPESWIDLNPTGSTASEAFSTTDTQQAGYVVIDGIRRASLWSSTAASWVDLSPEGATESVANAISGTQQAGYVRLSGGPRKASLWDGTAASWVDLSSQLTGFWGNTEAHSIWTEAGATYIAGYGQNWMTGRQEAILWIKPEPHVLTLSAPTVAGGATTSGTVTFPEAAPVQRAVVMTDNSNYVLMSTYCVVPANETTGSFKIWTYAVASTTSATISGRYAGLVATANLTLTPAALDLLWLYPTAVVGGSPSIGRVRLVGKAPAGGAVVSLSTSNPAAADHPASVTVPNGASIAQFPVSTFGVDATKNVVISSTYQGVTRTAVISVRPASLSALSVSPSTVQGGSSASGTVILTGQAGPLGRTVLLSTSQPKIVVPSSVYVSPQQATRGFAVVTLTVTSTTIGTITATQGTTTRTATLTLTP